jgi:hypothetical protein
MPDDVIGLRHWTLLLPAEEIELLRQRLADARVGTEPVAGGFEARDPWSIPLRVAPVD